MVLEHDDPAGSSGRLPQPVQHRVPPGPGPALGNEHLSVPYRSGGRLSRFALLSQRFMFAPRIKFSLHLIDLGSAFLALLSYMYANVQAFPCRREGAVLGNGPVSLPCRSCEQLSCPLSSDYHERPTRLRRDAGLFWGPIGCSLYGGSLSF